MAGTPSNLQPIVHFVINTLFVLGEGSALLRLWTKRAVLRTSGWDDLAMAIVAVINIGQHVILYLFVNAGAGRPQVEVLAEDPSAMSKMLLRLFVEEIWYLFLHFWIKMSFLLFFLRLSPSPRFHLAVYIVIGANVFVTVGTWILYCLQCIPIEAYWHPEKYPDVQCLPFSISLWLPACALIAVDFAIFFLPLSTVLSLQMTMKRRLQVLAVVSTGGASVLVSCLRLIVIDRFTKTDDFIWEVGNICIVSAAEMEVAVVAANMPGLRALWKSWRGGTLRSSASRSARSRSAGGYGGDHHRHHHHGGGGGAGSKGGKNLGSSSERSGGGAGGGGGDHALTTFSGSSSSKRSRALRRSMHDTELLLTVDEDRDQKPAVDYEAGPNHHQQPQKQKQQQQPHQHQAPSNASDEELGWGLPTKPQEIFVRNQVVVTAEEDVETGDRNSRGMPRWEASITSPKLSGRR